MVPSRPFRLEDPAGPGRVLRGKVDLPAGAPPAGGWPHAILLHGFKGFMDWGFFPDIARRLAERGVAAVRFNFSGSGVGEDLETFDELDRFERNTISREIEDFAAVRAWLAGGSEGIDAARGVWIGHSRGGGLALLLAAERGDCLGVAAWSAVSTFDRFDEEAKDLWRRVGYLPIVNARTGQELRIGKTALEDLERNRERFDVLAACSRIRGMRVPVLLVHGDADETVAADESQRLSARLRVPHLRILVPGAGHTFGIRHPMTGSNESWEHVAQATVGWACLQLAENSERSTPGPGPTPPL